MSKVNEAEVKKQIEYYMSDLNLKKDKFFYELIEKSKDGYIDLTVFQNCNKIKEMKIKSEDIVKAVDGSDEVELSADKKQIRRSKNKALPKKAPEAKKRDQKAADKEEAKDKKNSNTKDEEKKEDEEELKLDERGNPLLEQLDFENPVIIHFETDAKDADYKVNWKEIETQVKANFKKLKIVYSRADQYMGELAISSHKVNADQLKQLSEATLTVSGRDFKFSQLTGEPLKEFWQKQGGHYNFCIQPKLRNAKKNQKARKFEKKETNKRARVSYEIAGVYYADINKVKSKAKAIMNMKKDGEKVTGSDEAFMKEILQFHEKGEQKLKDFEHFEVNNNPNYEKTRCFFVVRKNGEKEDFSIVKCLKNLENKQE